MANIKSISLQNFKGCKDSTYDLNSNNATVSGKNASGKSTILDAFWWCLFNKDSLGNEKFAIRPLDAEGKQIDNIEIKVSVVMEFDGREKEFTKTQKQKWVKKRGSDVTELQGNENLYEIDGYPKTEKDYKSAIADIVSEDVFKMITNPAYFPGLKWKDQRDILMRFVSDVSDYELASSNTQFSELLDELQKAPSTDDIKAKYQKALNEWKKKQAEIPVRIDEAEKSKVDIDVAELELGKKAILELIKSNKDKQEDVSKQYEEYQKLSDGLMELKFEQSDLSRKANETLVNNRKSIQSQIDEKNRYLLNIDNSIQKNNREIVGYENDIESATRERDRLAEQWKQVNSEVFDESTTICPTCRRELPLEEIQSLRDTFDKSKADRLANIEKKGRDCVEDIKNAKAMIPKLQECNNDNLFNKEKLEKDVAELEKQLAELPTRIDVSDTAEYKDIQSKIDDKEKAMSQMSNADDLRKSLANEERELNQKLLDIEKQIAKSNHNMEIDERIEQLQVEQKEVAQKVADQEKMLYLLEQFIRFKMDSVSSSINSKFDGICWKLFENQINGGLKETCELTVNGVPYGSLNAGHRIVAGLQIIKALQGLYGVSMPVFVDNAESVNDFNMPVMDCQIILLKVSDGDLRVEV